VPGEDPGRALRRIRSFPGIGAALPVLRGTTTGLRARTGRTVQVTGPGVVLGIPTAYRSTFPGEIRPLLGTTTGTLLSQQTAANLHAGPGTVVRVGRPGLPPAEVSVDGIVDLPRADSLFQPVGAPSGGGPQAPPDNVLLVPLPTWHRLFDPVARIRPGATEVQIHADLRVPLPPDPGAAFADVLGRARQLEARLAGAATVGNDLAAQLDAARTDATYADLLFLLLAVPAAAVTAFLTLALGASASERRRREQALLRIRGASPAQLIAASAGEVAPIAIAGTGLGLVAARAIGDLAFGTPRFGATPGQATAWELLSSFVGLALAAAAVALPAWRDARRSTVRGTMAVVEPLRLPSRAPGYLGAVALLLGGLVFWASLRRGYQVVVAPEGVPTISVDLLSLFAPSLLWVGAVLLGAHLVDLALRRGRAVLARALRLATGPLSVVIAASMSRQHRALARAATIVSVAAAFAVSTSVFNATYMAQARVDAELTNGADVTISTPSNLGLPPTLAASVRRLPGVVAAVPMEHRMAYVGNDLQDLYGIDPRTIGAVAPMSDAFFTGGSAARVLSELLAQPDGVLVSEETVRDFQLRIGDRIRIRLQSARDHRYHAVPFRYVGTVRGFPTAPRDSFLVADAAYVARRTGSGAAQALLIRTAAPPRSVASEVRPLLGPASGAKVTDVVSQLRTTLSGLTAIDLSGLSRVELSLAVALGTAATGLVLALGIAERRRTFAVLAALGARARALAALVWSEAALVIMAGLVLGTTTGGAVAFVVVRILTGVLDPPPQTLTWPTGYLVASLVATICTAAAVAAIGTRVVRRPATATLRGL